MAALAVWLGTRCCVAAEPSPAPIFTEHGAFLTAVAFSPDGKSVAAGAEDGGLFLMDTCGNGRPCRRWAGSIHGIASAAFSPDGKTFAYPSGEDGVSDVVLWDVASGKRAGARACAGGGLGGVAYSGDGRLLLGGGNDGVICVWDAVDTKKPTRLLRGHKSRVGQVAVSADGRTAASVAFDGDVKVWDVAAAREQAALHNHEDSEELVALSPDGRYVVTVGDVVKWTQEKPFDTPAVRGGEILGAEIVLYDVEAGKERFRVTGHPNHWARALAYSPTGKLFATGAEGLVVVWDAETGKPQATLPMGERMIDSLAFSPDGKRLAAAGNTIQGNKKETKTGEVLVWDVEGLLKK